MKPYMGNCLIGVWFCKQKPSMSIYPVSLIVLTEQKIIKWKNKGWSCPWHKNCILVYDEAA